jgi:TonB-linked SusC/RagA family outer membrane protein
LIHRHFTTALVVAALLAAPEAGKAQAPAGAVTGVVTNKANGQPLSSAQVFLKGTRYGGLTNAQGRYQIPNVPAGTYTLVVGIIGFAEATHSNVVVSAGPVTRDFALTEAVLPMQALVATGTVDPTAGVKMPVTVARIGADQLQVPTAGSAMASIAGKVAGASVIRNSGKPGEGVSILLRTATASEGIEKNEPLFVVDGVILARSIGNTDVDIDPADIESMEIIKGAAASSLYGSRASAGVISITTKRGKNTPLGTTRMNYRMEFGQDFIGHEVPLGSHHFYRLSADGTRFVDANGVPVSYSARTSDPNYRIQDKSYPGSTYNNIEALFRPDQTVQQNLTLSQNNQFTTFFIALNRSNQRGAMTGNDGFWRNQGRISLDHRIGDKFSVSLVGLHSRSYTDEISGNPYVDALTIAPFVNLAAKDAQGNYLQQPDSSVTTENPLWRQSTRDNFSIRARTQGSAIARYNPVQWLTLDAQFSYDRADNNGQSYTPKGTPTSTTDDVPSQGSLQLSDTRADAYNGSLSTTLLNHFGDLTARTTFRASLEKETNESFSATGTDFVVPGVRDLSAAATRSAISSGTSDIRANGYLANLGLDFKDRYVFDGLIRRDGSSLFGPDERWHTYYRAAASYRISEESWFELPHVDELVFHIAQGTAGGRPSFSEQYELWNAGPTGVSRNTAGNAQLKPHHTREREFGVRSVLLANKLSLELVYATQQSSDQVIGLPVPTISGFNSIIGNAGIVDGHTYEATVNARLFSTKDVTLNISAVADRSRNKIVHWGRACFFGHTITSALSNHEYSCTGESRGDYWGVSFLNDPANLPAAVQARAAEFQVNDEGYLVWVGAGNTYKEGISKKLWGTSFQQSGVTYNWGEPIMLLDAANLPVQTRLGSALPEVNFGFTPNIRYRNASLYLEMRGQIGGKIYNSAKQQLYSNNVWRHADVDQSGKPDELKKTVDYYSRALYTSNRFAEPFIEDGTYLKFGAISARYRLGRTTLERFLGSAAPNDLTIGVTGRNLFTFTGYSGYDPEAGRALSRVENLGYPQMRTLTLLFDFTF